MLINPKVAIENNWVTGLVNPEKQIQPNAIDFTVDTLYSITENSSFAISEDKKVMRSGSKMSTGPCLQLEGAFWYIKSHTVVDFMSDVFVNIPEGVAATLIIRSTFNRNGLFLTSGLYDSGFSGHIAGTIHNRSGDAFIAPGTRLGQICFWKSDSYRLYDGGYNHEQGTHHTE